MESASNRSNARIEAFLTRHERVLLCCLCALALLRVFLFTAAFPFFNNVDEPNHFDTVVKYSKGYLPRKEAMNYEHESAELIVLYGSPEYLSSPEDFKSGKIPQPLWRSDRKQLSSFIEKQINSLTAQANHEVFSPPVYYALAGVWFDFGKLLGLKGAHLLYWIRFLNLPVYALLFWFAFLFCKTAFKTSPVMRFGILLLLAFFPQDVFYSINSDVLSPLFFVAAFYLLIQIYEAEKSPLFHFFAGITVSTALLVKLSNCPLLILVAVLLSLRIRKLLCAQRLKEQLPSLLLLISGCLLPLILWLGWNGYALGDITGNAEKIRYLGWTIKPLSEIWNHPVFSMKGLADFTHELVGSFWRGELAWGLKGLSSETMDSFYIMSSCAFVLCSVINSLISKDADNPGRRFIIGISALTLFLFILFLAALSTLYDFGNCFYPSREYPFFASGRLILGALVPFLILYLDGLRVLVSRIISGNINLLLAVLFICAIMTYSEIRMTWPVLGSAYNWFHLF